MTTYTKGQSVIVTFPDAHEETGRVAYQRMAPPDYATPAAVSVFLDSRRDRPGYEGTVFPASSVRPEDNRDAAIRRYNETHPARKEPTQ